MPRTFLIILLLYATTLTASAQATDAPTPRRPITPISTAEWPASDPAERLPQSTLDIVTLDQPKLRQHCRVHEIKADAIVCTAKHHRADTTFQREEILAIIEPPAHENLTGCAEAAGLVAATIAASFFVPFAWSLTLRIVGGFFLFAGWAANGMVYDSKASIGYHDHAHDILLYQRPNTPLTIHLHA